MGVLPGAGGRVAERLERLNVQQVGAVAGMPLEGLCGLFGKQGRTLHQQGTVFNDSLDVKLHGLMAWTLLAAVISWTVVYCYLLIRRYDLAGMEERLEERQLEAAVAARRAEGAR